MFLDQIGKYTYKNGKRHVVANIMSSEVPGIFPTDGTNIAGLTENDILDPGSTIYVINSASLYMMNEEGQFKAQRGE